MLDRDRILKPILELQDFAREKQLHGMVEGLSAALEKYIEESSLDETMKEEVLRAWKSSQSDHENSVGDMSQ